MKQVTGSSYNVIASYLNRTLETECEYLSRMQVAFNTSLAKGVFKIKHSSILKNNCMRLYCHQKKNNWCNIII